MPSGNEARLYSVRDYAGHEKPVFSAVNCPSDHIAHQRVFLHVPLTKTIGTHMGFMSRISTNWANAEAKTWIDSGMALVVRASQLCPSREPMPILRMAHASYLKSARLNSPALHIQELLDNQIAMFACLPLEKAQRAYAIHLAYRTKPDALNNSPGYQNMYGDLMGGILSRMTDKKWDELNGLFKKYNPSEKNLSPFREIDPEMARRMGEALF